MRKMGIRVGAGLIAAGMMFGAGCSSGPEVFHGAPPWIHQPTRSLDAGYIVYVGVGKGFKAGRADFKAVAAAIQDLANECSFAPIGARVEDRYTDFHGGRYQSFAKVAVSFADCDQAKKALDPTRIQALANVSMTQELKRYQGLNYKLPQRTSGQAPSASAEPSIQPGIEPGIQGDGGYFVARQQVAYAKEIVILNPAAYPLGSPQSERFEDRIAPLARGIRRYEELHPHVRVWASAWSGFERHPDRELPPSIPRPH